MDKKAHILLAIASLQGGGAERVLSEIGNHLVENNYEVSLLTMIDNQDDVYKLHPKIQRIRVNLNWASFNIFDAIIGFWRIRKAIRHANPDLVISFMHSVNIRILLALVFTKIPIIISERIDPNYYTTHIILKLLRRLTYPNAKKLVVQTRSVEKWAKTWLNNEKIHYIPNAIRNIPNNNFNDNKIVLAVGRLHFQKGFDMLITAFAQSELPKNNWQLKIVGEGDQRQFLHELIAKNTMQDKIILEGWQNNPIKFYQQASIFVLSSRFEGFPNALIEAMQCQVASIAFDCPSGPSEIIHTMQNGILCQNGNIQQLTQSLNLLSQDIDLRHNFAIKGAEFVNEHLSHQRIYGQWQALCEKP